MSAAEKLRALHVDVGPIYRSSTAAKAIDLLPLLADVVECCDEDGKCKLCWQEEGQHLEECPIEALVAKLGGGS